MDRPEGGRLKKWRLTCIEDEFTSAENAMWYQVCWILQTMASDRGLEMKNNLSVCESCNGQCCSKAIVFVDCRNTRLEVPADLTSWKSSLCKEPTGQYFNIDKDFPDSNTLVFFLYDICHVLGFLYPGIFYVHYEWTYRQRQSRCIGMNGGGKKKISRRGSGSCPRGFDGIVTWNQNKSSRCLSDGNGDRLKKYIPNYEKRIREIWNSGIPPDDGLDDNTSRDADDDEETPIIASTKHKGDDEEEKAVTALIHAVSL